MSEFVSRITDAEAKQLWQRAAELQEAAERAGGDQQIPLPPSDPSLSLEQVTEAAESAGIDPDYVLLAFAERQLPDADRIRRRDWRARWLRKTVSGTDAIEVRRLIRSSPERLFSAVTAVASRPTYDLLPENVVGGSDSVADKVLVYRLQAGTSGFTSTSGFNSSLQLADVRVLLLTLRAGRNGTHLRVRAPLFRRGINLGLAGLSTSLVGVGGSWSAWSLASVAAGGLGIAASSALLVPAGIGALAGGVIGLRGYRALYEAFVRKGDAALRSFVAAVELEAGTSLPGPDRSRLGPSSGRPESEGGA